MTPAIRKLAAPEGISLALLELDTVNEAELLQQLTLSENEQRRLASLKNVTRRRDWLAGRYVARQLLAELSDLPFEITADDSKPLIASEDPLFCNWSHSHGWLLAAATTLGPVGCDIERCKARPRLESLIAKSFAETEATTLLPMSEEPQLQAFFQLWTLKEAALKADGIGIGRGLKTPEFRWKNGWQPLLGQVAFHRGNMVTEHSSFQWAVAWEPHRITAD